MRGSPWCGPCASRCATGSSCWSSRPRSGCRMATSPARWLVTGAGGQLGLSLLEVARSAGIEAHGRDRAGLDVSDPAALARALDAVRPEVVVNAAAFTQVDLCESDAEQAQRVNARA